MMRRLLTIALLLAGSSAWAQNDFIRFQKPSVAGAGSGGATFTAPVLGTSAFFTGPVSIGNTSASPYANLYGDAANTLALRNSTNAQTFYVYNTTDGTNYERGFIGWDGNNFMFEVEKGGTGAQRNIFVQGNGGDMYVGAHIYPYTPSDSRLLGTSTLQWQGLYLSRFIQGSKSKTLTDNTATAFVRLSVADDDYEGCHVIYTAYAEDADTDARQTRTGGFYVAILNNSGTEACVFSTGDSAVGVTAGTLACTFDCAAGTNTVDVRATCDTSLDAAAETLTIEYRVDCPSTLTVAPQ